MPSDSLKHDANPSGDPDMDVLLGIVAVLRESRQAQGLTLRDLTHKMGIAYSYLSRAERGLSQPGLVVLLRWCRALDLRFADVFIQASSED